jgi:hypothetical protein
MKKPLVTRGSFDKPPFKVEQPRSAVNGQPPTPALAVQT